MAEVLRLNSKAIKVFDYRTVDISEFIPEFHLDEDVLKKDVERMFKAFGSKQLAESVKEGDMAVITCSSDIPKFCKKNITVIIGKGFFSKELEEKLIGAKAGEEFCVTVDGEEVRGTVDRVVRMVIPELNDENVKALGIEGVDTVNDLMRYCVDKQIEKLLDDMEEADQAAAVVWQALSNNSEFELDEEELEHANEAAEAKIREMKKNKPQFSSEEEKAAFEKEYEEEYGEPYEDVDMDGMIRDMYLLELKLGAMGYEEAVKTGRALTTDDYENYIDSIRDYFPGMTTVQLKAANPVETFAKERYNDIVCKELDDYVRACFKEKMNSYR